MGLLTFSSGVHWDSEQTCSFLGCGGSWLIGETTRKGPLKTHSPFYSNQDWSSSP